MFQAFRRLLDALEGIAVGQGLLSSAVIELAVAHERLAPATERLEELERSRHQFEALCEGLLLKAEGKMRAANNAEARERANRKSYEHLIDPLAEVGEQPEETGRDVPRGNDVEASETEGMQPVRVAVAPTNKQIAQRAKFGVR